MIRTPICIAGIGAATPVGRTAVSSAAAVRAGISRFCEHPYLIDKAGERMVVAQAGYLPAKLDWLARLLQLARPAIQEALSPLHRVKGRAVVDLILALPSPRPGWTHDAPSLLAHTLQGQLQPEWTLGRVETIARGHSAGLCALLRARERIQQGQVEVCLAGGLDSYLEAETLEWLDDNDRLHSASSPWGFMPGEGAAFCLLSSHSWLRSLNQEPLANLVSVHLAGESDEATQSTICTGAGLTAACQQALAALPEAEGLISEAIVDLNGEPRRADEFGFTLTRLSRQFVNPSRFRTPAECWGDVGAASGPLFACLAVEAWRRGYAEGPYTLLTSSTDGGDRGAAILRAPSRGPENCSNKDFRPWR